MKCSLFFVAFVLLTVFAISCSKSNEADESGTPPVTGGGTNCDTTNMTFAADVKPILVANCYACHSNANFAVSGIKLEDYPDLKTHVDDGDVLGAITHSAGYPPMPQGGAKLSDCNINKIRSWIDHGAQNN